MRDAVHTRCLVEALADASGGTPVSVKCRIGVHERLLPDGSVPDDAYGLLAAYVREVTSSGAARHVIVHARAAILAGLSPEKNRRVPPLRYDFVRRLADDFPDLQITLNGGLALDGVWRRDDQWLASSTDGVRRIAGVMVGRHALRRPLDLWKVSTGDSSGHGGRASGMVSSSRATAVQRYTRYACEKVARRQAQAGAVLMPLALLAQQLHEDAELVDRGYGGDGADGGASLDGFADGEDMRMRPEELRDVFSAVWDGVAAVAAERGSARRVAAATAAEVLRDSGGDELPTKRLSKMLAQALGKKEASKVSRNRAEAVYG